MPVVSGDEFVRILGLAGFIWDYTQGSHMILLNADGRRVSDRDTANSEEACSGP